MKQKIFEIGCQYKVKINFVSGATQFTEGELLTFEKDGYSPYDSSFAYEFRDQVGAMKTWWLHEDRALGSWQQYFTEA